jgi:hypothetical protein
MAESQDSRPVELTGLSPRFARIEKAPREELSSNRGFTELGTYALNRLRKKPTLQFYAWDALPAIAKAAKTPAAPRRNPLGLANYYQSLLDTGKFESRAALARFLGVSRARVTQVLNRLRKENRSKATALNASPMPHEAAVVRKSRDCKNPSEQATELQGY